MKPLTLQQAAQFCGGKLLQGDADALIRRVHTDSRIAGPGDLFVALVGERFDAHDFLSQVIAAKASAVLVHRQPTADWLADWKGGVILVEDTLKGLQSLARAYRGWLNPLVIGITGSNGKTSTKDLLKAVFSAQYHTTATLGNLNNHIGVPLTLLSMEAGTEAAVVEMGMNHFGEIEILAQIAQPRAAVITNIGVAHIEHMGSREGIAREKGMLVEAIPSDGVVVLNANDDMTPSLAERTAARVITAGVETGDVRAEQIESSTEGSRFVLSFPTGEQVKVLLPVVGTHMVGNAALAAACAWHFGVSPEAIAKALSEVKLSKGRLEVKTVDGVTFLDDSYNANPDSMRAGLKTLADFSTCGKRIAVLGRMGELGEHAERSHRETGELVASLGLDALCTVGDGDAQWIGDAAQLSKPGLDWGHFKSHEDCAEYLRGRLKSGDVVLLKGSRSTGMEQVLKFFQTT